MKNRYEGLLVLNVKGTEDNAREIIEKIEAEFKKDGAEIDQTQKMGTRSFSYAAGELASGYYVNFIFRAEPVAIEKLKSCFRLNADVYRQTYLRLPAKVSTRPPRVLTPNPNAAPVAA